MKSNNLRKDGSSMSDGINNSIFQSHTGFDIYMN